MADKSWRNAELVLYAENLERAGFWETLSNEMVVTKYAWILHDKDEGKVVHVHCMVAFRSVLKTSTICNKFGIRENQIERIKGTWADALDYLTHRNAPAKHQYDASEVHSNFEWEIEAQDSTSRKRDRLKEVIVGIGEGTIREYNLHEHVGVEEYTTYRRKIEDALKWRRGFVIAHLEELVEMKNVVWVFGQTGTGKTTFAKSLAKSAKMWFAITSTGRNPFDEYRDEPCLILDDLRPEDMRFSDLLGILDPYNFKAAHARYQNKALQTEMLIITTILTPEEFVKRAVGEDLNAEDGRQLYRRINAVYELTQSVIYEYEYNDDYTSRIKTATFPNAFLAVAKKRQNRNTKLVESALESLIAGAS